MIKKTLLTIFILLTSVYTLSLHNKHNYTLSIQTDTGYTSTTTFTSPYTLYLHNTKNNNTKISTKNNFIKDIEYPSSWNISLYKKPKTTLTLHNQPLATVKH